MTIKAVVFDAYGTLYDTQSVDTVTEEVFPGHGEIITQIWRLKQLEYSWLRALMGRHENFSVVTRDALAFTLRCLGLTCEQATFERIMAKYLDLALYPDVRQTLAHLKGRKLAILSNGSEEMLQTLVRNTRLDTALDAVLSVETRQTFKPAPEAYTLIESELGCAPHEALFVSSNPFDVCGAKSFGLTVAWIERVTPEAMARELAQHEQAAPSTLFKLLRTQMDELGLAPDYRIRSLSELPKLVAAQA